MFRTCILLAFFLVSTGSLTAQHMPGAAMGNYAGTQALYHNPAFVADSRYSVHVNLIGAQLYLANNHIKYNPPYSFLSLITNTVPSEYRNDKGAIILPRSDLVQKLNGRPKHLNLGAEARLPSVMFTFGDGQWGLGLTSRVRTMLNMTEVTEPIAQALRSRAKDPELIRKLFENQSGKMHLNGMGEVGVTLGRVLIDNETDFFKVGITAKRVLGLYNAHIVVNDGSFSILPDPAYSNQKELINLPSITAQYGYTSEGAFQDFKPNPYWMIGRAPAGSGWGFDLGVVYEYRPDVHKYSYTDRGIRKRDGSINKYLYRVSLALTDLGSVKFKNPNYVTQYEVTAANKRLRHDQFQKLKGGESFFNGISQSLGVNPATRTTTFRSVLPMALQASVDYQVQPKVYVNTLWVQNLRSTGAFGMKGESVLAVTPRYENRWYEVSVPVSLMNRYSSLGIGLAGRVGPVWFGTDHLAGLLNIGKPKVFNLYAGVSMGLFRKPPKTSTPCFFENGESFWQRLFNRRSR